ncbi:hypothetical protein HAX54_029872 [Datura stramonium]|uniref:Uncharacterized protein n=1 Tax=Datura stramonium TaxID=4076 RepID=A0ABS8V7K8_DATST|nr:hypothetical protein [Datura stramonium]
MASKGKEVVVADPSIKRARKEKMGASFSAFQSRPKRRRFGGRVQSHGLTWFNTQKEAKFSAFIETPLVDHSEYFILPEKPPYRDNHHTLCGERLIRPLGEGS